MAHLFIRHRVKDYAAWERSFNAFAERRRQGGERSFHLFRPDGDPNNVVGLFEWDSLDNARRFFGSADLKEAMAEAGVVEPPEEYFLEEVSSGVT